MILPFDSHNHVHIGPNHPLQALLAPSAPLTSPAVVCGMAIMSTHPRDFDSVKHLATKELPSLRPGVKIVPCFGVHPWFLHEIPARNLEEDRETSFPRWLQEMEGHLIATPGSIVGEIGLDGFHFDPETRELVSPMDKQVYAFRLQMELAVRLQRPVSIHSVRCMGPLMDTLNRLKKTDGLPPKIYFHAFGGKVGTIDQLLALCGRDIGKVYFGFAPIINFRSSKTAELIRKVGLERLLLETDHEDASLVPSSIEEGIQFISKALDCSAQHVVECTTRNAYAFYNLES